jgi:GNAT superfamily N-acetyltransferase
MSYLHRWAATPTLRRWWPLVKTLFGENFQSFAQARLGLPSAKGGGQVDLRLGICPAGDKHGYAWQRLGEGRRDRVRAEQTLWFCLELALPEIQNQAIQIGLAAIEVVEFVANWEVEDVFIPPELRGGGFSGRFLDEIVAYFTKYAAGRPKFQLRVLFRQSQPVQDQAGRQELVELIDFYKSRGFKYESAAVDVMVKVIIGGVSTAP